MSSMNTKNKIMIEKSEYLHLKKLDKRIGDFIAYVDHLVDIRNARHEIQKNKTISQEKLFGKLGL